MKRFVAFTSSLALVVAVVAACTGGSQVTTMTVSGRLLQADGTAAANRPMLVNGQSVTTDAAGNFVATEVTAPYDLVVHLEPQPVVFAFQGLTTAAPVLVLPTGGASSPRRQFELTLQPVDPVTAGPPPSGSYALDFSDCGGAVYFDDCGIAGFVGTVPAPSTVGWNGDAQVETHLFALKGYASNDHRRLFTHFTGFAYRNDVVFVDGGSRTVDLTFRPVSTTAITGEVNVPAGYELTGRDMGFMSGNALFGVISSEDEDDSVPMASAINFPTPDVHELDFYLTAVAKRGDSIVTALVGNLEPDADVTLDLPTPPQLLEPLAGAMGVGESSTFSWTPMEDAVHFLTIISPSVTYLVLTVEPTFELPDLSAFGLALGSVETFDWHVMAYGRVETMDDLTKGVAFNEVATSTVGSSGMRSGTTAP